MDLRLPTPHQHSHKNLKSDDFSSSKESADVLRTPVRTHGMAGRSDGNFVQRWGRVGDEREEWETVRDSSTSLIVQQANSQMIAVMERALGGPSLSQGHARAPLERYVQGCIEEPHATLEVIYISFPSQLLR